MVKTRMQLVAAAVAAVALSGCTAEGPDGLSLQSVASQDAPVTASVPSSAPTSSPAASTAAPTTAGVAVEDQVVLDAYIAFYDALSQANADPPRSQDYLAPVATGAQFEQTNGTIKADFLAGEVVVGSPVMDPEVVSVDGVTAVVQDCQDTRDVVLQDAQTGEALVVGQSPDSVETTLQLVDGVWKVSASRYADDPAEFCS